VHIPLLNVPDWSRCARELDRLTRGATSFVGPYGIVSLVGYGLTGPHGLLAQVLGVLERSDVTPIALSASPLRISATIDAAKLEEAQRVLHATFVR
jgi:aspartate kinase